MKEKLVERIASLKSDVDFHNTLIDSRERPDGKTWEVRKAIRDTQLAEIAFIEGVLA